MTNENPPATSEAPRDKLCTRCTLRRPLERFAKRARARDGLRTHCRDCEALYARSQYAKQMANFPSKTEARKRVAR